MVLFETETNVILTMLSGKATVVKRMSSDRKSQYFILPQGIMSVEKQRMK